MGHGKKQVYVNSSNFKPYFSLSHKTPSLFLRHVPAENFKSHHVELEMEAVGLVGSIAALINVTLKTIKYLNSVKEASDDRLKLSAETSSLLPLLISLKNQVDQKSNGEVWFDCVKSLAVENGPIDQLREALVQLTEKLKPKPKNGLKNFTRAIVWPFDKCYCEEILGKVERAKSRISLAVQQDTFSALGQAIKADTALTNERVSTLVDHTDNQQFKEEAGAGKSVIASVVVHFLRSPPVKQDSLGVAAMYCNFKERDQQSAVNLLAGCCVQLIQQVRKPLGDVLADVYKKHDSGETRPVWKDIVRIFEDSTKNFDVVYLVVDALDECSERARRLLLEYFKVLPARTRLLVTTRHIDEITCEFRDSPKVEIHADPSDLEKYITSRIADNRRLGGYVRDDPSLQPYICDKVTTMADGMFLAAKLQVESLSTKTSIRMLKRALENLSSDLNVLYNDALSRIESQNQDDRELAEKALRWVAYTYRRFPVRALQEALAIDPDETDVEDEAMTPIGLILDVCAGLLILDEEDEIVRLVHYTAQDYFDMVQTTRFDNVHATIACDCVTYLSYECFQHSKDSRNHGTEDSSEESSNPEESTDSQESSGDTLTSSTEISLLWYASSLWAQHAMMANRDARLGTKIHQFLAGNPRVMLEKPRNYYYYPWKMPTGWLRPRHGLEIAAFFGFCDELEGFYKDSGEVGILTDDLNLLHLAVHNDQASAIQVLLDHGANIERRDPSGLTPLHRAIRFGSLEAATALVNNRADVVAEARQFAYSRQPEYLTPIASVQGNSLSEFLDLLLGAGAKIQARDIFDQTPLMQSLIKMNDVQTAETLLKQLRVEQPMDQNSNSKALLEASEHGTTEMVDMLLKYGADINSEDKYGETALHMALRSSKIDTVNLLLARGAATNSTGWLGTTPLHYAADGGNEDCLLAVLRSGADVNQQDVVEATALHVASENGNLAGVKVLLAHGANREALYLGKTPLISAIERENKDCALALFRNGADANAQNDGISALHMASFAGSLTMTHELCQHHATVGTRSTPTITLKYLGSSRDLLEIQREYRHTILDTLDSREVIMNRVLKACSLEHLWGLRYLLSIWENLLDVRVWKEGVTALDLAVLGQHDEIVRFLKSLTQSATESESVPFEEYLFNLLRVSSAKEAEEELKWRIEEQQDRETEEFYYRRFEIIEQIQSLEDFEKLEADMRSKAEAKLEEEEKSEEEVKFVEEERIKLQQRLDELLEKISTDKRSLGREMRGNFMEWTDTLNEREKWETEVEKQLRIEKI
ncbi:MAG: hypothetical protein Q9171_006404 [Xanthocarpia ochracea]